MINEDKQKEPQIQQYLQEKDYSIVSVVNYLSDRYGNDSFFTNDFWDGDLCAIGLFDKEKKYLFYISTYLKKDGVFYVSCETIGKENKRKNDVSGEYRNIDIKKLDYLFSKHIGIEETPQNSRQK